MKQKRDLNGKFVKMYPSREEYEAKIALLAAELDDREQSLVKVDNELKFWKQEYNAKQNELKEKQDMLCNSELHRFWFLKHCGFILRWRYYRAVDSGEL